MSVAVVATDGTHRAWIYAQRRGGRRLHLAEVYADGAVKQRAVCGMNPDPERKSWRMTINVPMKNACHNCVRIMWP